MIPFVQGLMDVSNTQSELAYSMFNSSVTRATGNPQTIEHPANTLASYAPIHVKMCTSNINAGILSRSLGSSTLEGGQSVYAVGLPFCDDGGLSLDNDQRDNIDDPLHLFNDQPPPFPPRVRQVFDLTVDYPNAGFVGDRFRKGT